MLVVCNGAPKSGSTWITKIVQSLSTHKKIPSQYQNEKWKNPSLKDYYTNNILSLDFYKKDDYFCKQHWSSHPKYKLIARDENVRVLNIVRDLRDVCVSRYYHDVRLGKFDGGLEVYFQTGKAKKIIVDYIKYHQFWHDGEDSLCFLTSYEALHKDFLNQVDLLLQYIGFVDASVRRQKANFALESTRFENKQQWGEGKFLRRGKMRDYVNYLVVLYM